MRIRIDEDLDSSKRMIQRHLRFSKADPLRIVLYFPSNQYGARTHDFNFIRPLFEYFERHPHRIRNMAIVLSLALHFTVGGHTVQWFLRDLVQTEILLGLQDLEIVADPTEGEGEDYDHFIEFLPRLPQLQTLALKFPSSWWIPNLWCFQPEQSLSMLKELSLQAVDLHLALDWMKRIEFPVLEALTISCRDPVQLHEVYRWRQEPFYLGRSLPYPSVRRLVLYGLGEHASRLILNATPNIENLAVDCDKQGRIPTCLSKGMGWDGLNYTQSFYGIDTTFDWTGFRRKWK